MAAALPFIGLAAGAVSAVGQVVGGIRAKNAAEANAKAATEEAGLRANIQRQSDSRTIARARAAFGASGVTMQGSPLQVQAESMRQAEQNAYMIIRGGQIESAQELRAGRAAEFAGYTGAIGTGLRTAYGYGRDKWDLG